MIVVSDTTALSNLLRAGDLFLLERIYGRIFIPQRVHEELMALESFGISIKEISESSWIEVKEVKSRELIEDLLEDLDEGEAEAIALAMEIKAEYLLIDEKIGRKIASASRTK